MTAGDQRAEVRKHLEAAVQTDDPETMNYHVREALQFLRLEDESARAEADGVDGSRE